MNDCQLPSTNDFGLEKHMRCSLAIHELKAFPDVPAAADTVRILEDVYARLEQLQRNI